MKPITYYDKTFDYHSLQSAIVALIEPSIFQTLKSLLFNWFFIALAIFVTMQFSTSDSFYFLYPLCVLVIGARQHALLIMMHDGAHGNLHPNRTVNEYVSDLMCAFPHFLTTEGYRKDHLAHHRYVGSMQDPNWNTKLGLKDWQFPKTRAQVLFLLVRDLFGYGIFRIVWFLFRYKKLDTQKKENRNYTKIILRLSYYFCLLSLLLHFQIFKEFALFWLVPFFTVLPTLLRLRTLSEHYGLVGEHDFNVSRNYSCNFLEKFFLSPHNVHYHLDHHLYMTVPFFKLPKLHEILQTKNDYVELAHQSTGILRDHRFSVLSDLARISRKS